MKNKLYLASIFLIVSILLLVSVSIKGNFWGNVSNTAAVGNINVKSLNNEENIKFQNAFNSINFLNSDILKNVTLSKNISSEEKNRVDKILLEKVKERKYFVKDLMKNNPMLFLSQAIPSEIKSRLSEDAQKYVETRETISGIVDVIHIDDFKNPQNSHFEYFLTKNGKKYNLYTTRDLNIKSNTSIEASGYILDENIVIDFNQNFKVVATQNRNPGEYNRAPDSVGNQRVLVLLLKDFSTSTDPFSSNVAQNLFFNSQFRSFHNFMKEQSYGKVSFSGDVYGWITLNTEINNCHILENSELLNIINNYQINLANYDRIVYAYPGVSGGCSFVGKSNLSLNNNNYYLSQTSIGLFAYNEPSGWGVQPFIWTNLDYILAHELGHALGVVHANSWICNNDVDIIYGNCQHYEYGNFYDTMGRQSYSLNFNAYFKEQLGWLSDEDILTINSSGIYTINPLELKNGVKLAKVNIASSTLNPYFIEFRKAIGFDLRLNSPNLINNQNGIFINRIQDFNIPNYTSYPASELIDMSPNSNSYNSMENVTLNLPDTNSSAYSLIDGNNGITIGPVLSVSSSSISFNVDLRKADCKRVIPNYNIQTVGIVAAGSYNYLDINFTNEDYYGCDASNFYIIPNLPSSWKYSIYPENDIFLGPGMRSYFGLNYRIPENTLVGDYNISVDLINRNSGLKSTIISNISVTKPVSISSIDPSYGPIGTSVVLTGEGFNSSNNTVGISGSLGYNYKHNVSSLNGKINFIIPQEVEVCNQSCYKTPTPNGDYRIVVMANGSYAEKDFHVGANPSMAPSASIIATSTLTMEYEYTEPDSISPTQSVSAIILALQKVTKYENSLVARFTVKIDAGNSEQTISKEGAFGGIYAKTDDGKFIYGNYKYTNLSNLKDNGKGSFIIPANKSAIFMIEATFNPKMMFAGKYYSILERVYLGEYPNQKIINFSEPKNTTNSVVIIGEVSPYITSVSPNPVFSNKEITITGVRFATVGNVVQLLGKNFHGQQILNSTNNGREIKLIPNVPVGDYSVYIEHPKTGRSNFVGLNIIDMNSATTTPPVATTTIQIHGGGGGGGGSIKGQPIIEEALPTTPTAPQEESSRPGPEAVPTNEEVTKNKNSDSHTSSANIFTSLMKLFGF